MANKILVFLEQRGGEIKKASLQAFTAAKTISELEGGSVEAVTIGSEINNLPSVGKFGIEKTAFLKNDSFKYYTTSGYAKALTEFIRNSGADVVLFANTAMGKDLAPKVAAKLDAGIGMDCIDFNSGDGKLVATRPVYAGKALIEITIKSEVKIFTVRPNVFTAEASGENEAQVEEFLVDDVDLSAKVVSETKAEGKLDVAEAEIIVSGGRGLKGPENWNLVEDLAKELGAATGASRAAVDAGWRPHSEQVGQTGKTVSPNLYVALGISGAIQHLAGMRSSKYIVAVNKDPEAPIFQVADYGIVGDVFEVVPQLIEEVKKIKS